MFLVVDLVNIQDYIPSVELEEFMEEYGLQRGFWTTNEWRYISSMKFKYNSEIEAEKYCTKESLMNYSVEYGSD